MYYFSMSDSPTNLTVDGYTLQPDGLKHINKSGSITCGALGFPTISYVWQWNDDRGVSQRAVGSTLDVSILGPPNYTCLTNNSIGSASIIVTIYVDGECLSSFIPRFDGREVLQILLRSSSSVSRSNCFFDHKLWPNG